MDIVIPKPENVQTEDFRIPFRFCFWRRRALLLDDIDKFAEKSNFLYMLEQFVKKGAVIIATCRLGPEHEILCHKMERYLTTIFGSEIRISHVTDAEAEKIARETDRELSPTFDGNIGSIFLPLDTMKDRFKTCDPFEQEYLRSIRKLYYAGLYSERETFSVDTIEYLCKVKFGINKNKHEWDQTTRKLESKGFLENLGGRVKIEETYIQHVIEDGLSIVGNLNEMLSIFGDNESLIMIASRAFNLGLVRREKAQLMKIAISACNSILGNLRAKKDSPMQYAMTMNNLGNALRVLGEVEDKALNCKEAVKAYKEALKVYTFEDFPMQYEIVMRNLRRATAFYKELP